ncbi:MAG: hypothetical protein GY869_11220, partial [Planctomycetes bacterium]|nr:hypothetical protein [Planctomycetota bacterium]
GFVINDELYITGRLKDLIIIRGRNYYPQDIEKTAEESHPALRTNCGAAFSVDVDGIERLVIMIEVERRYKVRRQQYDTGSFEWSEQRQYNDRRRENVRPGFDPYVRHPLYVESAGANIRQAVTEQHNLQTYAIVILKAGSIPRTSSGKIKRRACRAGFLDGSLGVLGQSILEEIEIQEEEVSFDREMLLNTPVEDRHLFLETHLLRLVSSVTKISRAKINRSHSLNSIGIDSLMAVELQNQLS